MKNYMVIKMKIKNKRIYELYFKMRNLNYQVEEIRKFFKTPLLNDTVRKVLAEKLRELHWHLNYIGNTNVRSI